MMNPTSDNDTLNGGIGADSISGLGGNDLIRGRDNNDTLNGGPGNDRLRGENDHDSLIGGSGNDDLIGGSGRDTLVGGPGIDTLVGGPSNDTLTGGGSADRFEFNNIEQVNHLGGNRYQVITSAQGVDRIQDLNQQNQGDRIFNRVGGGPLQPWQVGSVVWDEDGGTGPDGNGAAQSLLFDSLYQGDVGTIVSGQPYQLASVASPDLVFETFSGSGNHTAVFEITPTSSFKFSLEVFDVFHSAGIQTVEVEQNSQNGFSQVTLVSLDNDAPEDTRIFGDESSESLEGNLIDGADGIDDIDDIDDAIFGRGGDDTITGLGGDDIITGGAGSDRIRGEGGNDSLYGNSDQDWIDGGSGDDIINGGEDNDTLRGAAGNDAIQGWTGNDRIIGAGGQDSLNGEYGNDNIRGGSGDDTLSGGFGFNTLNGGGGQDLVTETGTDFVLTNSLLLGLGQSTLSRIEMAMLHGLASDDRIDASAFSNGSVTLNGGNGDDTLLGGVKNDNLLGFSGNDSLIGGEGNDILAGGSQNDTLDGGAGNDSLDGQSGNDLVVGGAGNDTVIGGSGDDTINGGAGQDTLLERSGAAIVLTDTSLFGIGTDQLFGIQRANIQITGNGNVGIDAFLFTGQTTLRGGAGDNLLVGGSNSDRLRGNNGDDILAGNAGNDFLSGGNGNDVLAGGAGLDTLIGTTYASAGNGEQDTLDGGNGNNRTLFILGDTNSVGQSPRVFYEDSNSDFARINNFDVKNFGAETTFDKIQLAGDASDYVLLELESETQIRLGSQLQGSRLIARVSIQGNGELDLNNSDHFQYVDRLGIGIGS